MEQLSLRRRLSKFELYTRQRGRRPGSRRRRIECVLHNQAAVQVSAALGPVLSNATVRAVPDISFFAGNGFNSVAYIYCQADNISSGASCNLSSPYTDFVLIGGTSVPTPAFAGIMALVDQKTRQRQGNSNYVLYGLAALDAKYTGGIAVPLISANPDPACIFNDAAVAQNANRTRGTIPSHVSAAVPTAITQAMDTACCSPRRV